ncbi:diguanylate cyclase DgcJ [Buttiauxella sp.]|uniref:diguanylate cyclase DgcJ n=1 Tax=Buttiauxella sp. TaxID=1972222 RepID=UPI003C738F68
MMLKHKILRGLISTGVIAFTSIFFVYELTNSYHSMNAYMHYIIEKAESSFIYDKYQNQTIASNLSRHFNAPHSPLSHEEQQSLCAQLESARNVKGFNLTEPGSPLLQGTFQTLTSGCSGWTQDLMELKALDNAARLMQNGLRSESSPGHRDNRSLYYVDLQYRYIYSSSFINANNFTLSDNDFIQYEKLSRSMTAVNEYEADNMDTPKIYQDALSKQNIMSILTPVYNHGNLKGIVISDYKISDLKSIFYPTDRPLVYNNLDITIVDLKSNKEIIVKRSKKSFFNYVRYNYDLPQGVQIQLSLDVLYFLLSSWKVILFYIISTAVLLHLVRLHFRHHINVSKDNISDSMTNLYNRKVLSAGLETRLQRLVSANIPVTFIALDCDKLKYINDTWGHKEGDRAIITLGKAILSSVRQSDYPIRLGGDEFYLILIDFPITDSESLIERIATKIKELDDSGRIHFSWGASAMAPGNTLDEMYKAADAQLYLNKMQKK